MFYKAGVGEAAPVGETVAPASEVGADQDKMDELRSLIQGHSHMRTRVQDFHLWMTWPIVLLILTDRAPRAFTTVEGQRWVPAHVGGHCRKGGQDRI